MKPYNTKGLGKHQRNALAFIKQCSGWQGYDKRDRNTKRAIETLAMRGLVFINEYHQFKYNPFLR